MKPFNSFSVLPFKSKVDVEICHNTSHTLIINVASYEDDFVEDHYVGSTAVYFQFKTEAELANLVIAINEAFEKEVRK
jgi:hypothetical protein